MAGRPIGCYQASQESEFHPSKPRPPNLLQRLSNPPFAIWVGTDRRQYLDLVAGAEYQFALIVTDYGGVSRAFI